MTSRRDFLRTTSLAGIAAAAAAGRLHADPADPTLPSPPSGPLEQVARDEAYWGRIAAQYRVPREPINLEGGYFGLMANPVLEAYHRNIDRANGESSYFARREYPAFERTARQRVASFVGTSVDEVVLTRGATEALQALIGQYQLLQRGDTVLYADLDYNAMQWAMNALAARHGASVARLTIPEPASTSAILAAYTAALDAHPRTKLLLVTHCNNKTGLIHPVRDIVALAKARGADVIVDAAHSFGQIPLTMDELGADFVGLNLHKWVGAPIGAGAMYIRAGRLDAIGIAHGDEGPADRITTRIHTGTTPFATTMTIPDALDFQLSIGIAAKAARLRYLRDRWVHAVRDLPGVTILTPEDPALTGAITSFRLHGRGTREANAALAATLLDEFGIFTFQRSGIAGGDCVRVTPALYNMPADLDRLADAIRTIAARP
jgi:selenocysteine lyase/cysteine desulfurase